MKRILLLLAIALRASAQSPLQSPTTGLPSDTAAFEIHFREAFANGNQYVGIKGADSVVTSFNFVLPGTPGTAGECFKTSGGTGDVPITTGTCDSLWTVWTSADSVISVRTASVGRGIQVPYVRLSDFGTGVDTNGAWKLRGTSTATDSSMSIIDSANVQVLKFNAIVSSVSTYEAEINSDLVPPTDDYGKVGKTGGRFHEGHFNEVYMDACFGAGCGGAYWSRTGTTLSPSTVGDDVTSTAGFKAVNAGNTAYMAGNKIEIHQGTTGNHQDFVAPATNVVRLLTTIGTTFQQWDSSGAPGSPNSILAGHWFPSIHNTYDQGVPSLAWRDGNFGRDVNIGGNLVITGTCTGCGSGSLPVVDTTSVVKGSGDATKLMRFEVDGFTTATTRVLTPQNASYILAAQDFDNVFTTQQSSTVGFKATNGGGTAYAAANKLEIHQGTTGNFYVFEALSTNVNVLRNPSGGIAQTWNATTSPATNTIAAHFLPTNNALYDLGIASTQEWRAAYVHDRIQISTAGGYYTGATLRIAGVSGDFTTGNIDPETTGKNIGLVTPYFTITGDTVYAIDVVASNNVYALNVLTNNLHPETGTTITLFGHIVPTTATTFNLGDPSHQMGVVYSSEVRASNLFISAIAPPSGTQILLYADLVSDADNTRALGTLADRWSLVAAYDGNFADDVSVGDDLTVTDTIFAGVIGSSGTRLPKLWVTDIDCSGVCGGSKWTDAGATTYLTATGDTLCVGCTSTSFKAEISGTFKSGAPEFAGTLLFTSDNSYNIGQTANFRPQNIYATGTVAAMYAGTAITGAGMHSSNFSTANSGGTLTGLWTTSSGLLWASGGFSAGAFPGTAGQTTTITVRDSAGTGTCTIIYTGGLKTGGTCT